MATMPAPLAKLGHACYGEGVMRVNVGQAKTDLSRLLARVEAGEEVEIARNGVPVAKLVRIEPQMRPGERFMAIKGALAGQIFTDRDFEFSEEELDEMYAEWDDEDEKFL
ncbi:MAG TPA: type II toxin-antitoxin system prevent-host-death family antitoxin [Solirubrobacteraceae bacterium]|nr:type II toxin-antitoxin system prevent-host-death family antitoxin [Solirubrobacteraceae bacterium]HYM90023.1 type II toxin-antitoxin system prevent-host-death family antitoxin [bacterium]